MTTLFLVITSMEYELEHIISCHERIDQAIQVAETAQLNHMNDDLIAVRAVAPGPGAGVTVARWVSRYATDGSDQTVKIWTRQF